MISVRRHQKLSLFQTDPVTPSSKMGPLLIKAGPVSPFCSASVIIYFSRSRKHCTGVRICDSNSPADIKVSEEEGGGCDSGTGAEIPLQPVVKTMIKAGSPPAAHGGSWQT